MSSTGVPPTAPDDMTATSEPQAEREISRIEERLRAHMQVVETLQTVNGENARLREQLRAQNELTADLRSLLQASNVRLMNGDGDTTATQHEPKLAVTAPQHVADVAAGAVPGGWTTTVAEGRPQDAAREASPQDVANLAPNVLGQRGATSHLQTSPAHQDEQGRRVGTQCNSFDDVRLLCNEMALAVGECASRSAAMDEIAKKLESPRLLSTQGRSPSPPRRGPPSPRSAPRQPSQGGPQWAEAPANRGSSPPRATPPQGIQDAGLRDGHVGAAADEAAKECCVVDLTAGGATVASSDTLALITDMLRKSSGPYAPTASSDWRPAAVLMARIADPGLRPDENLHPQPQPTALGGPQLDAGEPPARGASEQPRARGSWPGAASSFPGAAQGSEAPHYMQGAHDWNRDEDREGAGRGAGRGLGCGLIWGEMGTGRAKTLRGRRGPRRAVGMEASWGQWSSQGHEGWNGPVAAAPWDLGGHANGWWGKGGGDKGVEARVGGARGEGAGDATPVLGISSKRRMQVGGIAEVREETRRAVVR
ncbi:hypothetical protein CYMTET_13842 [Cymbomonas tetramitiformis]|uniref:Uncharacterized protein n=1 Tax=Cymbomonas tetramitiformis TaxID=36881 RepID=A0AAE0GHK6_9CHLO|nr:hypothetical protein CYMTET_13842 [Cymbomonas tetramitiformis]